MINVRERERERDFTSACVQLKLVTFRNAWLLKIKLTTQVLEVESFKI